MPQNRQRPHPPPPRSDDPARRLLAAVESIAENLEGLRRDLAAIYHDKRSPIGRADRRALAAFTDLAADLLAPYLRRR